jgi:hypothetical protein
MSVARGIVQLWVVLLALVGTHGAAGATACDSNPCQNGGECIVLPNTFYTCQCVSPWVGDQCQTFAPAPQFVQQLVPPVGFSGNTPAIVSNGTIIVSLGYFPFAAYVWTNPSLSQPWVLSQTISLPTDCHHFATSDIADDGTIVLGCGTLSNNRGRVFVFSYTGSSWVQTSNLQWSTSSTNAQQGLNGLQICGDKSLLVATQGNGAYVWKSMTSSPSSTYTEYQEIINLPSGQVAMSKNLPCSVLVGSSTIAYPMKVLMVAQNSSGLFAPVLPEITYPTDDAGFSLGLDPTGRWLVFDQFLKSRSQIYDRQGNTLTLFQNVTSPTGIVDGYVIVNTFHPSASVLAITFESTMYFLWRNSTDSAFSLSNTLGTFDFYDPTEQLYPLGCTSVSYSGDGLTLVAGFGGSNGIYGPGGPVVFYATCASSCQNGGTCVTTSTGFSCTCPATYTGNFCQGQYCSSNPCLNDATCVNNDDSYTCECLVGYWGDRCEFGQAPMKLQQQLLTNQDPTVQGSASVAVCYNGSIVAQTGWYDEGTSTMASIWGRGIGTTWSILQNVSSSSCPNGFTSTAMTLDASMILFGCPMDGNSGYVSVFLYTSPGVWIESNVLSYSTAVGGAWVGYRVLACGQAPDRTIIASGPFGGVGPWGGNGQVYVWRETGTVNSWAEIQVIDQPADADPSTYIFGDWIGISMINNTCNTLSAASMEGVAEMWVFQLNQTTGQYEIIANNGLTAFGSQNWNAYDQRGYISYDGTLIGMSGAGDFNGAGAARVFNYSANRYENMQLLAGPPFDPSPKPPSIQPMPPYYYYYGAGVAFSPSNMMMAVEGNNEETIYFYQRSSVASDFSPSGLPVYAHDWPVVPNNLIAMQWSGDGHTLVVGMDYNSAGGPHGAAILIDNCAQVCQNGGTCFSYNSTFACVCPPPFTGTFCQLT